MIIDPVNSANLLLRRMGQDDLTLLTAAMDHVSLTLGQHLVLPHQPIEHIYFLESGVASIVSDRRDGVHIELAVIGREGATGLASLMGGKTAPYGTLIQIDHAFAWRIPAAAMVNAMEASTSLRNLILRYVQSVFVQIATNVAANVADRIDARLARWLLMCHDRVDGEDIAITHEFMGLMLGTPRTAVTRALHVLESEGAVRAQRGRVVITDRDKLETIAGAGYGEAEEEYRRLIGPFGKFRYGPEPRSVLASLPAMV